MSVPNAPQYNVGVYVDRNSCKYVNAQYETTVASVLNLDMQYQYTVSTKIRWRKRYEGVIVYVNFYEKSSPYEEGNINASNGCPLNPVIVMCPALMGGAEFIGARLAPCPSMTEERLQELITEGVRALYKLKIRAKRLTREL